jgi:putative transposase
LAIIDGFNCECLALVADTSLPGLRVVPELDNPHGGSWPTDHVYLGNGTELTSMAILRWSQQRVVEWHYIALGKPRQNAFAESFTGRLRDNC